MKRFLSIIATVLCFVFMLSLVACGGNTGGENPPSNDYTRPANANINESFTPTSKTLVAYFSKTNTTKNVAEKIQELTDADIFEIERKEPYPDAYTPTTEVAKDEKDANARPELAVYLSDEVMEQYDTIILGFPIWWHTAPMAVLSFLNYYDLSGKIIYTFCTSGGSAITESTVDVRNNAKEATVIEGKRFSNGNDSSIENWVDSLGLIATPEQPIIPPTEPSVPDSGNDDETQTNSILIVYFSWSGNTVTMANNVAKITGGDIVEIEAAVPYSGSYNDVAYGRAQEEAEANARPEVAQATYDKIEMSKYDTVFVGFPIWWHTAPMIIGTFLEHYTWTAEIDIYPFFQGASNSTQSYYDNSMAFVRDSANGATVHDGLYAAASNTSALETYLRNNGFMN